MSRVIQAVRKMFRFKSPYPDIGRMNHETLDRHLFRAHEKMDPHKHAYAARRLNRLTK